MRRSVLCCVRVTAEARTGPQRAQRARTRTAAGECSEPFLTRENRVQQRDRDTGEPVWVVDVMDFDPEARERTFKVKITAPVQPVPPDAIEGLPVRPVVLEGLMVTPYLKEVGNGRSRIAYSLRATGMSAPRGVRVQGETKAA